MQHALHSKKDLFSLVVAIIWIPLLFASAWIINHVVYPSIAALTLIGISVPVLASVWYLRIWLRCRYTAAKEMESWQPNTATRFQLYANFVTPILLVIAAVGLAILAYLNGPFLFLAWAFIAIGYLAVLLNLLCSLTGIFDICAIKYGMNPTDNKQVSTMKIWGALIFSVDAVLLTAFFTYVIRLALLA